MIESLKKRLAIETGGIDHQEIYQNQ